MRKYRSQIIWSLLALSIAVVLIVKHGVRREPAAERMGERSVPQQALPRLVDLGAGKCIPCKMMAPILEDLKKTLAGTLDVQFIDVWENPEAGRQYGINVIPTQIFYDARGKELFRHEGFMGKEDILAKWKEFGMEFIQ